MPISNADSLEGRLHIRAVVGVGHPGELKGQQEEIIACRE